jgi:hypothetical protein
MIKDNCIYFGYGSIVVSGNILGLTLVSIKPPQPIGPLAKDCNIEYGKKVQIDDEDVLRQLKRNLQDLDVTTEQQVQLLNYTLIFIPGSHQSLDILKRGVQKTLDNLQRLLAC